MDAYVGPGALLELLGGALRLRLATYREVSREQGATKLSIAVAALSGAATAPIIGTDIGLVPGLAMIAGIVITLIIVGTEAFLLWGMLRLTIGEERSFGQVVRPLAIAEAPRLGYLLVPVIGFPDWLAIVVSVWAKATFLVGVAAAVDRGWREAILAAVAVGVLLWAVNAGIQRL